MVKNSLDVLKFLQTTSPATMPALPYVRELSDFRKGHLKGQSHIAE